MAFTRPANNKQLDFGEIANRTKLREDEVGDFCYNIKSANKLNCSVLRLNCL